MEILQTNSAMLSNYEVMTLLADQKTQRIANEVAGTREVAENLRTVEFEVKKKTKKRTSNLGKTTKGSMGKDTRWTRGMWGI
jgi:hypothetical protein